MTVAPQPEDRPIVIFTGPSLSPMDAADLIDADIRPPAAQGDLIAAVLDTQPCAVGLIDGVFESEPAVRHKEILWALNREISVFGAASMGALRAAELSGYGMVGVGLIYRWYRRVLLAPDDAVAVTHGPSELAAAALSDALINLRMTFKSCRRSGVIDRRTERRLVAIATNLPYRLRTRTAVLQSARREGIAPLPESAEIDRYWKDQKRDDAVALLRMMETCRRSTRWPVVSPSESFDITDSWADDLTDAGFSLDAIHDGL
jgi:hypothetical protein